MFFERAEFDKAKRAFQIAWEDFDRAASAPIECLEGVESMESELEDLRMRLAAAEVHNDALMIFAQGVVNSATSPMGTAYEWPGLIAEARALIRKVNNK